MQLALVKESRDYSCVCGAYLRWRQLLRPGVAPGPSTSEVLQLSVANGNSVLQTAILYSLLALVALP